MVNLSSLMDSRVSTRLPFERRRPTGCHFGEAARGCRAHTFGQSSEPEEPGLGDLAIWPARRSLREIAHHEQRHMIAQRYTSVEIDAEKRRSRIERDVALLKELARQRLVDRLPDL